MFKGSSENMLIGVGQIQGILLRCVAIWPQGRVYTKDNWLNENIDNCLLKAPGALYHKLPHKCSFG